MKRYIGIDLGTTNSAICSFDGTQTRIWKSPEQNDVTPSAIYVDRHGHRYYGRRAYEMAPADEKNAATLFKRYLGTSMKYTFANSGETLTPEECSAEILRTLYGYLPADWREDPETVCVITVPAAFNQMKKDATLRAAQAARIGQVALMQEPVAAVMSVMKERQEEGAFLIYDLGGGTFDVSVAEYAAGQVNLLAQGGKEMCGGRDWDRLLFRETVCPWLKEKFHLPEDLEINPAYRRLRQLALYACEQAKIELSHASETYIRMYEESVMQKDLDGKDIYLDIPYTQSMLNAQIRPLVGLTVQISREVIAKSGIPASDIRQIVFIGGPTMYQPLQDQVREALKIPCTGTSNPMTAVAEGASIYAESIDWSSDVHERRETLHVLTQENMDIRYEQRVSADRAKIAVVSRSGMSFTVEAVSADTGWSSGQVSMAGKGILEVPLSGRGEHYFTLSMRDLDGREIPLKQAELCITRVMASIRAIPSSHAIALKVLDRVGGQAVPLYLVRENERLPKSGTVSLRAGKRLIAGSGDALLFTLWEGEIVDPIEDNRYIGTYRIPGTSFFSGVIAVGAEILCEYEISDSGNLRLGVSIPSVGAALARQNYYSSRDGQLNLEDPSELLKTARSLQGRLSVFTVGRLRFANMIELKVRLEDVIDRLQSDDPEMVQEAANDLLDCQRQAARFRQEHLEEARVAELNGYRDVIEPYRSEADPASMDMLDDLYDSIRRAIDRGSAEYDTLLMEYRVRSWTVLQKIPRFIETQFQYRINSPDDYTDTQQFNKLRAKGLTCIENKDYTGLDAVISQLNKVRKPSLKVETDHMYDPVSVVKG